MPRVKIDYIVSFSSEDSENPASNLLASEISKKKWTCSKGEPSCSVVLQLTRAVKISSLQIGAYHTALVEVLVGLSEKPNEPFEVLVPSSVFLSPSDSRRGEGAERVRSFGAEYLAAASAKRWDRVRVVCSQPYNKFCKYGLSFIHIFEPDDNSQSEIKGLKPVTAVPAYLGMGIGAGSSDEEDFKPGELFAQHLKKNDEGSTSSTDAQIRQATSHALKNQPDTSTKLQKTPISKAKDRNTNNPNSDSFPNRKRESLMYTDDDDKPHEKIDNLVTKHNDEKQKAKKAEDEKQAKIQEKLNETREAKRKRDESRENKKKDDSQVVSEDKRKMKPDKEKDRNTKDSPRQDRARNTPGPSRDKDRDTRKRTHSDDKPKKKAIKAGPITDSPHTLMRDVVFVLSGYENPRRGALRDAGLAMGGRYERDWRTNCTHLICAFPNTPKLKAVRSSPNGTAAVVVTGEWIEECCKRRRRLPWQWYATEAKFRVAPDDDEEEDDLGRKDSDSEEERASNKRQKTEKPTRRRLPSSGSEGSQRDRSPKRNESNANESTNSVEFIKDERYKGSVTIQDSDSDSTEEDTVVGASEIDDEATLPDFFDGHTFAIDEEVKGIDNELLKRYVRAYGGVLIELSQLDEDTTVDYYLSSRRSAAPAQRGVRPDWVWRCHEKRQLWPVDEYLLC